MQISIPKNVRGLVFDCDGTLADTMNMHYRSWRQSMARHNHDFPVKMFHAMAGIPTVATVEILNEQHGYRLPVEETVRVKEELFQSMIFQARPIEPVVAVVREFAGRLPMAVATGGSRAMCILTLQAIDLLDYFAALVTADDVQRGKPAPDIFLEAARRLEIPPADCWAFEDGDLGIQSAREAGMTVVDVRNYWKSTID
jgi:beta-phosphoglucomutase family hydrolase